MSNMNSSSPLNVYEGVLLSNDDHSRLIDKFHGLKYKETVEDGGGKFEISEIGQTTIYYTYTYTDDGVVWVKS